MERFAFALPLRFGEEGAFDSLLEEEARRKVGWLITLRWFASAGLFLLITLVRLLTPIALNLVALYAGNAALLLSNVAFRLAARRGRVRLLVELQILDDLLLLAWLISCSGGFENPFISFSCFHMIIASIFLRAREAYGAATLAVVLLSARPVGETLGMLAHRHLVGQIPEDGWQPDPMLLLAEIAALAATLYLTVYLTSTIVREVNRHRRSLLLANVRLGEQDREKSRYVRIVSHDLRAPVSAIQSCLRVVLDGFTGDLSEKSRDMVHRAERRSVSLLRFLEELAYLSSLRSETESPRAPVSLAGAIDRAVRSVRERIEAKRLKFDLQSAGEVRIHAHADTLERLVGCLLENAIAYTPEGGSVELRTRTLHEGGDVELTVRDTGIGIPRDEVPRVLRDFYRGSNARQVSEHGAGLGLSIVKEIVERYDGTIAIDTALPGGTSVVVTLPCGPRPREERLE
jgi:signal transduction histidine kinase